MIVEDRLPSNRGRKKYLATLRPSFELRQCACKIKRGEKGPTKKEMPAKREES